MNLHHSNSSCTSQLCSCLSQCYLVGSNNNSLLNCTMTLSMLFILMEIIICFLNRPLVVMLNLGLPFWFESDMMLWISETLLEDSFRKVFLILIISLILLLNAWAYDLSFNEGFGFDTWIFLKNFSKILLLSLGGIGVGSLRYPLVFP